jgi:putative GTP pyrophosphokinase
MQNAIRFPGGSKEKVNRAGNNIRLGNASKDDLEVFSEWRAAHRAVLNTFQANLRNRSRGKYITVATRHKRKRTIIDKLNRFPQMDLSRMDDVAGCRLIFQSINDLHEFRNKLLRARFKHLRRNKHDKYDYIQYPKNTGYRGVHDVYSYNVNSRDGRPLTGLLVEIQYRTLVQHAWATAVEVIGLITESQPKFQKGDIRYQELMAYASEILARAFEHNKGPFPDLDDREVVSRFLRLDSEMNILRVLRGLNRAKEDNTRNRNYILLFKEGNQLEVKSYKDSTEALRALFQLENDCPGIDIVLVRADSSEDVRLAFTNYFSDARSFIEYIEKGCEILSAH